MKKFPFAVAALFFVCSTFAQVSIIPKPNFLQLDAGSFNLNNEVKLVISENSNQHQADFFAKYLNEYYGIRLKVVKKIKANEPAIILVNDNSATAVKGAYELIVNSNKIKITGKNAEGVFYGIQSLIQLLPTIQNSSLQIQAVQIKDAPRFGYRGMMLDVSRHFFSVEYVKKFIDYLALHKMNTFHWHLVDDQGWRIEIKKYPNLTKVGAYRNGTIIGHHPGTGNDNKIDGGYYTQKQIRDVVAYAAKRFITVVPEIEMPGHASAAIAAYPLLSCFPNEDTKTAKNVKYWAGSTSGKQVQQAWGVYDDVFAPTEYTFNFLQDVLDEVIELFPSKLVHIGGDECPKGNWKRSEFCQNLIKEKGLKDEHELQSYFIARIEQYLNSKGRDIIGWDEILEGGLAPNASVMSWRGEQGGIEAAKQKHPVVMTPTTYAYFDYAQHKKEDSLVIGGFLPLHKVYGYNPLPDELSAEEQSYILGAQANLWTEYIANAEKVEYMLFPRMTALSEVLWTVKTQKNYEDFLGRLIVQFMRFDLWKTNYSKILNEK